MAYKVFIEVGKGKNYSSSGSTPLKTKTAVYNWVKRNPLGSSRTQVRVFNTRTKNYLYGTKAGIKVKFSPIIRAINKRK